MDAKGNIKKRKVADKPLCKYGLLCYQKNPEHQKKFKHPIKKVSKEQVVSEDLEILNDVSGDAKSNLPPVGDLIRSPVEIGTRVWAPKKELLNVWLKGTVYAIEEEENNKRVYKIRLDSGQRLPKPAKRLAYENPASVIIPVGTRIIARYTDSDGVSAHYVGIVVEPPQIINRERYLIFFDDGWAQYVNHEDIYVVCAQSLDVADDVHEFIRDFVRGYLEQYPERPMVKLQVDQVLRTEYNFDWFDAKVLEVDCSMVKVLFLESHMVEWIYRGSTRLKPVKKERNLETKNNKTNSLNEATPKEESMEQPVTVVKEAETTMTVEIHDDDETDHETDELSTSADVDVNSIEETVDEILKLMPKDLFDFWKFCTSINKGKPEDAFSDYEYHLVGIFDLLAKKLPKDKKVDISCHWRYYFDPPEFQTVIKKDGKDCYHIGYFRDEPSKKPSILVSNSAAKDSKLNLVGDNIFCAMNSELSKVIKSLKSKDLKGKATKLQKDLMKFAAEKKYPLTIKTNQTKKRQEQVVAKTFNGLGIVVPVKNDIGYRPLPDSDAVLKTILKKIISAENRKKQLEEQEALDEIISNVHFANDECDYGMGLELGLDLFCDGDPYFHEDILRILPLAYDLLNRSKYAAVISAHLKNRRKGEQLSTLNI